MSYPQPNEASALGGCLDEVNYRPNAVSLDSPDPVERRAGVLGLHDLEGAPAQRGDGGGDIGIRARSQRGRLLERELGRYVARVRLKDDRHAGDRIYDALDDGVRQADHAGVGVDDRSAGAANRVVSILIA